MSLGARNQPDGERGFWLRVRAVPDFKIDLRLHVPSFQDRQQGEIYFAYREAWHLSKCVMRKAWLLSYLAGVLRMCLSIHVSSVANLTSHGLYSIGHHGRLWSRKQLDIQDVVSSCGYLT